MILRPYDRQAAVTYAHRWACLRNPDYYNFEEIVPIVPLSASMPAPG